MNGPVRFVFSVIWLAIVLDTLGTLRSCTKALGDKAAYSQRHEVISLGNWNRKLIGKKLKGADMPKGSLHE